MLIVCCFFKQKTAYEMRISDWSSDVCSSDLVVQLCDTASDRRWHSPARRRVSDHRMLMASTRSPLVEFHGVEKRYAGGSAAAVAALDLAIGRGEFLTLLGPSGSGKTTTLMMLAGFETPNARKSTRLTSSHY